MAAFVTTGCVERGRFRMRHAERFAAWLKPQKPGEFIVRVERATATRSQQANAFYWGVVLEAMSGHTGFTPDELHEWAKCRFLPKRLAFSDGNGEVVDELVIGGSTAKLNVNDFYDFVEHVRQFAAEHLDLVIPDPHEEQRP